MIFEEETIPSTSSLSQRQFLLGQFQRVCAGLSCQVPLSSFSTTLPSGAAAENVDLLNPDLHHLRLRCEQVS
jgi:hypothetical protein